MLDLLESHSGITIRNRLRYSDANKSQDLEEGIIRQGEEKM